MSPEGDECIPQTTKKIKKLTVYRFKFLQYIKKKTQCDFN